MKVGIYQSNPEFGNVEKNIQQALEDLDTVDTDLMVLPELFNTGYQFVSMEETHALSEEIPEGRTCKVMADLVPGQRKCFWSLGWLRGTRKRHTTPPQS